MLELFIDNRAIEMRSDSSVVLSASLDEIIRPAGIKQNIFPLRVPMTPKNRQAFGHTEQILSIPRYNQTMHPAVLRCKGTTLIQGEVELVRCEISDRKSGWYVLNLIVDPPQWITDARNNLLQNTPVSYQKTFSAELIQESWSSNDPVKFLPVKRDRYPEAGSDSAMLNGLSTEDYHPFVQVKALLDAIVGQAGYRFVSEFLNEPFFKSLYMSGNYPDFLRELATEMDFNAEKRAPVETTADAQGKVYATVLQPEHSVGNPADTVDSYQTVNGKNVAGSVNYGNCFQLINGRAAFVPTENAVVLFEYRLRYKSSFVLFSPDTLKGFNQLQIGDNPPQTLVPCPLVNVKDIGGESGYYKCAFVNPPVFSSIRVTINWKTGGKSTSYLNTTTYQIYAANPFDNVTLEYNNGKWTILEGWALYDEEEYNAATAEKEIDVTVRTTPELRLKNVPCYLDNLVFMGADAGAAFTLFAGSTVKPVFYSAPIPGSSVTLSDILFHNIPQIQLIEAVSHLFGLHFYTDELTKTIYAEPRFTFLNRTHEIDWSEKIDHDQPILLEEAGDRRWETETFLYRNEDRAVRRKEAAEGPRYGSWSFTNSNRFAEKTEKPWINPFFNASVDETNAVLSAPAASLIVAGDRNASESPEQGALNFPAKIVRFLGVKNLPAGQLWGWPSNGETYPLAMFHSAGEDQFTLCFNDQGGQLGLKNYYQPQYETINNGKKLTLFLRLTPSDMEAILHPNSANRNFRGNFVFVIQGEKIRGRLRDVSGYDPEKGESTRCVFTLES